MPLPCVEELEEEKHSHDRVISQAVVKVVVQATEGERVTSGVHQCMESMNDSEAENMMLCLMDPLPHRVPDFNIFLQLIKDWCRLKAVPLMHVQGGEGQTMMTQPLLQSAYDVSLTSAKCAGDVRVPRCGRAPVQEGKGGCCGGPGCIMIKYPKGNTSFEDDLVIDYIKDKVHNYTDPRVTFPDLSQTGKDEILGSHFKLKTKKMKTPIQASSQPTTSSHF